MGKGQSMTVEHQLQARLRELVKMLEQIESVVSVAVAALHHQNCERDADVARVLQRDVGDRLSVEIEKAGLLLEALQAGGASSRPRK